MSSLLLTEGQAKVELFLTEIAPKGKGYAVIRSCPQGQLLALSGQAAALLRERGAGQIYLPFVPFRRKSPPGIVAGWKGVKSEI